MSQSTLMLHRGAREVSRDFLKHLPLPQPQGPRHIPVGHAQLLDMVTQNLADSGFEVTRERFGLSRDSGKLFAVIDLSARVNDAAGGITLACGIINSVNCTLSAKLALGSRCFCCDNLSLSGEVLLARKHTKHIMRDLAANMGNAMRSLSGFQQNEARRLKRFQSTTLTADQAHSIMLQAFDRQIVNHVQLRRILHLWQKPPEEFADGSLFALENHFTTVLADVLKTNPIRFAAHSLRLQGLLGAEPHAQAPTNGTAA